MILVIVVVFGKALEFMHIDRVEESVDEKQQFLMAQWYVSFAFHHQL